MPRRLYSSVLFEVVNDRSKNVGKLRLAIENDKLVIINDSTARKFVNEVEHITFSGAVAASRGQQVLYVTERCVFVLTPEGLALREIAPGIDVKRDIIAQMDFKPIVRDELEMMDARIFRIEPMGLPRRHAEHAT